MLFVRLRPARSRIVVSDSSGKRERVPAHGKPGRFVEVVGIARVTGRDDGLSGRHRLGDRETESLGPMERNISVAGGEKRLDSVPESGSARESRTRAPRLASRSEESRSGLPDRRWKRAGEARRLPGAGECARKGADRGRRGSCVPERSTRRASSERERRKASTPALALALARLSTTTAGVTSATGTGEAAAIDRRQKSLATQISSK